MKKHIDYIGYTKAINSFEITFNSKHKKTKNSKPKTLKQKTKTQKNENPVKLKEYVENADSGEGF